MAYTGIQRSAVYLGKGIAGVLYYTVGTAEAQVITASKNGGDFAAVNAGTVAVVVGGTGPATLFKLTINLADTATVGPIAFLSTGATDNTVILANVVDYDATKRFAAADAAVLPNDLLTAVAVKADAVTKIAAGVAGIKVDLQDAPNATALAAVKTAIADVDVNVASMDANVIGASQLATDALGSAELAATASAEVGAAVLVSPRKVKEAAYQFIS